MSRNLEYYVAQLDHWPFEVGVDLNLDVSNCKKELPFRAHIRLELNHPTDDGLCTVEEEALLVAVQEEILSELDAKDNCFVASVTHRNARTLVFYMRQAPDSSAPINEAMEKIQTHKSHVMWEDDADWTEYSDVLMPSENFRHQIKDRSVLREFERRGDDCSELHNIEPRFAVSDAKSADALAEALRESGFGVKEIVQSENNGNSGWQLTGLAQSPLALAVLDEFRPVWLNLADKVGAEYAGWSAEVMPIDAEHDNTGCDGHLSGKAEDYTDVSKPE
ncbi:MAG: regulator of RNase E activity RraB [Planctomycetota bacterium]|jgi:regulator of RNase E activity RraB